MENERERKTDEER